MVGFSFLEMGAKAIRQQRGEPHEDARRRLEVLTRSAKLPGPRVQKQRDRPSLRAAWH
ncbi:hypothetical protein ACLOJK_030495 [Asimina triloba]